jgi:hypothetical protein
MCIVLAADGRVGAFALRSAQYSYVLSDVGDASAGDRVVVEVSPTTVAPPRLWIGGQEITFDILSEASDTAWTGGDAGSYLDQNANGQNGASSAFPLTGTWPTMPESAITDGTWGDLTIYNNQTVAT